MIGVAAAGPWSAKLKKTDCIVIIFFVGMKFKLFKKSNNNLKSEAGIYMIECKKCSKKCISEMSRNLNKLIDEYKMNLLQNNTLNVFAIHCNKCDHNFELKF